MDFQALSSLPDSANDFSPELSPSDSSATAPSPKLSPSDSSAAAPSPELSPSDFSVAAPSPELSPSVSSAADPSPEHSSSDSSVAAPSPEPSSPAKNPAELYRFFPLLFRQKYIRRWGLMHCLRPESLSEHSLEAAFLAHALALLGNRLFDRRYDPARVALLALFHDVPEVYTGDLPTPVKYFDRGSRESYALLEQRAVETLLCKLPPFLREDYRALLPGGEATGEERQLVKAADKLCAYLKCLEEHLNGNREFDKALEATGRILDSMNCPELSYFRETFLPAFSLTIDELQL